MKKILLISSCLLAITNSYGAKNDAIQEAIEKVKKAIKKNDLATFKNTVTPSLLSSDSTGNIGTEILHEVIDVIHTPVEPNLPAEVSDKIKWDTSKYYAQLEDQLIKESMAIYSNLSKPLNEKLEEARHVIQELPEEERGAYIKNINAQYAPSDTDKKKAAEQYKELKAAKYLATKKQIEAEITTCLKDPDTDKDMCEWMSISSFPMAMSKDDLQKRDILLKKRSQERGEMIKHLKDLGVDLNKPNKDGLTPLLEVVDIECGGNIATHTTIASRLIELGANVNAKTPAGKTPLDIARKIGPCGEPLIKLLEEAPSNRPSFSKSVLEFFWKKQ